jgi:hypothetical protein
LEQASFYILQADVLAAVPAAPPIHCLSVHYLLPHSRIMANSILLLLRKNAMKKEIVLALTRQPHSF